MVFAAYLHWSQECVTLACVLFMCLFNWYLEIEIYSHCWQGYLIPVLRIRFLMGIHFLFWNKQLSFKLKKINYLKIVFLKRKKRNFHIIFDPLFWLLNIIVDEGSGSGSGSGSVNFFPGSRSGSGWPKKPGSDRIRIRIRNTA